ncbi:hypothetical protein COV17_01460 [Candidatus Woesearchaeota archaeon CG10_big_fil_rev_8_21_14_0_10_36_11]|nr:MAG: hypothetical protein COV17_01460 [Candidatus Woesearchaeota archaeon CG10_big_fil_rev_8_21_14_0_10_36_11]
MIGKKRGLFVVVLGIFLLSFLFVSSAESDGCYVYPESGLYCTTVSQSVAETDCVGYDDCSLSNHFIPLQDCSSVDICRLVVCDIDCDEKTLVECQQQGLDDTGIPGIEVPIEQYDSYCTPGCCTLIPSTGENQCQYPLFKRECDDLATKRGFGKRYSALPETTYSSCQARCNIEIVGSILTITVLTENNEPIPNAVVKLLGTDPVITATGNNGGTYTFTDLQPSTYVVKVESSGYRSAVASIPVEGNEVAHQFTLTSLVGARSISGKVSAGSETGLPLENAIVSIRDVTETITSPSGTYSLSNIPSGIYTITASKMGFSTQSKQVPLPEETDVINLNFVLQEQVAQGAKITVLRDGQPQPGASVYINGTFRGVTQHPDGVTNIIPLTPREGGEDYNVFATFQNYNSNTVVFTIIPGETKEVSVELQLPLTECNCDATENMKPVEGFLVQPVLGKRQFRLSWNKPCAEVTSYKIVRTEIGGEGIEEENTITYTPSGAVTEYVDVYVEWGKTYAYSITAHYVGGPAAQCNSVTVNFGSIEMGDAVCESRYTENAGWDNFCQSSDRTQIFTCNTQNKFEPVGTCESSETTLFCTQISQHSATCSGNSMCSLSNPVFGNPFGLYFTENECYGTQESPNYCYYDYTNTSVNTCNDCLNVESCFEYQSKSACTQNRCVGTPCEWVDGASQPELVDYTNIYGDYNQDAKFVTAETGAGYCVEESYDESDQCSLCDSDSPLFENYYCTANVCGGLGKCFSQENLEQCNSCPDVPDSAHTCYSYVTEQECTGDHAITNDNGKITVSEDSCNWGRCSWTNPSGVGQCIKDGDVDGVNDCLFTQNEYGITAVGDCKIDNMPPRTRVSGETHIISTATPNVTFSGSDYHTEERQSSALSTLYYCITNTDVDTCTRDKFVKVIYASNKIQTDLTINVLDSEFLHSSIDGEVYKIKFFSTDIFHNQETVQEEYIYADTTTPQFTIHDKQTVNIDRVDLTVYLEDTNEPMICTFTLKPIFGDSEVRTSSTGRENNVKDATFINLPGIRYDIFVFCTDDYGNSDEKNESYVFNLDQRITIVRPASQEVLATTSVIFEVRTGVAATCELYNTATNQHITSFMTTDGKLHTTSPVSGFVDGNYPATYKTECSEQLSGDVAEAYFDFAVDFTPPKTYITLQEGGRTSSPTSFGWEEVFIETVNVTLTCDTDGGFDCAATRFCLGSACDSIGNPNYQEYVEPFFLEESTEICYYSTDTANNPFPEIICGTINIDGYGITFVSPESYTYEGETWGISNTPTFDWTFYTKVPTTVCKFDFLSGFNYHEVEQFKTIYIVDGQYTFPNFPGDTISSYSDNGGIKNVYVQCENEVGEVGPEYTIHLEYDPSVPEIANAYADPDTVIEGISTDLFVETDDKTLCKYSDNSDATGTHDYFAMEYSFPGTAEKELFTNHQDTFSINFIGTTKGYSLLTQCMNGAGDVSNVEIIDFSVDYSIVGNIISVFPQGGYFAASDVVAQVETNKNAVCEYELDTILYPFTETGGRVHTFTLIDLEEGEYIVPVRCLIGEHLAETTIMFTIDTTPPEIVEISDGNYTCGSDVISVFVTTDEDIISGYSYEVYDKGVVAGSINASVVSPGGKVLEATVGPGMPINISTETLLENHTYYVKLYTWDEAGNIGQLAESNGVVIINENHSLCYVDKTAPSVTMLSLNSTSCTHVGVSLQCADETSCTTFDFSQSYSSDDCTENISYAGQNILFNRTGWVCYSVSDPLGNSLRAVDTVEFDDEDGDGILTQCDICSGTDAGKVVDGDGCSSEQLSELERTRDYDNDTLPDAWEKLYNAFNCEFNSARNDSDSNGIVDQDEDYDGDGKTSYQEYIADTDPCDASSTDDEETVSPGYPPSDVDTEDIGSYGGPEPGQPTDFPSSTSGLPILPTKDNTLAFAFLFIGLVLVLGGIGYLVYYYNYSQTGMNRPPVQTVGTSRVSQEIPIQENVTWKDRLSFLQRKKETRVKEKSRKSLFGSFTKSSSEIPHVNKLLQKKSPPLSRVQDIANKYVAHKDEIQHGLQSHEKSIFTKLESIAKKTKTKDITEVVSKSEAKEIFAKLKKISEKRKGGS